MIQNKYIKFIQGAHSLHIVHIQDPRIGVIANVGDAAFGLKELADKLPY